MRRRFIAGLMLSLATSQVAQAENTKDTTGKDARKSGNHNNIANATHVPRSILRSDEDRSA